MKSMNKQSWCEIGENMRILIITTSALMGGTERFIINFLKVFSNSNEIEIMLYKQTDVNVLREMKKYAAKIYIFPYYVKKPCAFYFKIKKFYKGNLYDYVYIHANTSLSIVYTFPLWFKKNEKIIYHSHNSNSGNALFEICGRKIIDRVCFKRFACSDVAAKFMYGKRAAFIIKNGIDVEKYQFDNSIREKIREKLKVENNLVIGHIGHFNEQKNHLFLIEVFVEVLKIDKNAKLVLIGNGEKKRDILEKIERFEIGDYIIFVGNNDTVNEYYQAFDVFVLPSLYEGLPFVGIEAQASGLPCLFSSSISTEVRVTPLVHFIDLKESKQRWAQEIISLYEKSNTRENYSELIENAGFGLESLRKNYKEAGLNL